MDLKPVTRTSVLGAVALWAFYCLIVVVVLPMLFAWSGRTITVLIMIVLVAAVVGGVLALRPRSAEGADYIITSYGARSQGELTVPVPVPELPGLVEETCRQDGELRLRELDARGGRISVGMTFSSWGDRARFTFHPPVRERVAHHRDIPPSSAHHDLGRGPEREESVLAVPRRGTGGRKRAHECSLTTIRRCG
ncbi:hypothetical protein GKZ75_10245 [Kocuria indica]|uniref:Uncharacterized protein n=1 Tax=Kocuria marina subsp. indica TaxID=1049583 RepID=A0A6N9QZA3_9MICC|nr:MULTISPECIES: hypothetical protein [Kocuria]MCT1615701.1 hypothetical protein [Kocuria marina]NDO78596.1 hypothetical protein [Kocuria indica]